MQVYWWASAKVSTAKTLWNKLNESKISFYASVAVWKTPESRKGYITWKYAYDSRLTKETRISKSQNGKWKFSVTAIAREKKFVASKSSRLGQKMQWIFQKSLIMHGLWNSFTLLGQTIPTLKCNLVTYLNTRLCLRYVVPSSLPEHRAFIKYLSFNWGPESNRVQLPESERQLGFQLNFLTQNFTGVSALADQESEGYESECTIGTGLTR